MPRLSKEAQEARDKQESTDGIAAARINEVLFFFHAASLFCCPDVSSF